MRTHIKVIAIVNIVLSALGLLSVAGVLLGGLLGSVGSGSIGGFLGGLLGTAIATIIGGAVAVFGLIAGFGLLNHKGWARIVAIVVSIFRLFAFPIGTVFGAYSLWVLFNAETKTIFELEVP